MQKKLYICDGLSCNNGESCYVIGGPCIHTTDENHSIKKILGDKFPPTTFADIRGTLVETGDVVGVKNGSYIDRLPSDKKKALSLLFKQ